MRTSLLMSSTIIAILLLFVGQAGARQPSDALVLWITEQMQRHGFPGASIAVIRGYQIEWARSFGLSDKENGTKVTERTLFQAASVSKAVAAAAAMIAVEDGQLGLDVDSDSVLESHHAGKSVGSWSLPNKTYPDVPVTLRMLLSHTGGTSDFRYSGYRYGYFEDPPKPIDKIPTISEELRGLPPANTPAIEVIRKPGVYWKYSPAGYTVVQAALMATYDEDFSSIMSKLVLEPLDMRDSTFTQPVPNDLISQMAVPYLPDGTRLPHGPRVFNTSASGGLITTATDLAKFVIAVQQALRGETRGFITPRIAHEVMTRQPGTIEKSSDCIPTADPTKPACQSSWGLGFDVNVNRYLEHQPDGAITGNYFAHTGFNSGYLALILGSKTDGNGLVMLVNMAPEDMSGPVPQFAFIPDLVRRVADEEGWR